MTTAEHSPLRPKDEALPIAEMSSILERHPNWPHLNVSFYFGPHTHRKDSKDIGPHIEEADICLMENVTPEVADFLQETLADNPPIPPEEMVAKGRFYDRPIEGSYWEPIVHALHGTKKAIGVMEQPDGDERNKMMEVLHRPLPLHRFIEVSAAHLGANLAESAQLQENREQIMVNVFENEIDRILEERPELKDKPELNTLITMGAYHTRLRHTLAANSVESRREFATDMPMVYGYQNVTQREYAYGRQPSEELLEQAWVENALSGTLASKLDDYEDLSVDELVAYYRTVIPSFSHEQRRDLHAIFYEHGHDAGKASAELDAYLQENGFGALPQNASEVRTAPQEQDKRRHLGKKALSN